MRRERRERKKFELTEKWTERIHSMAQNINKSIKTKPDCVKEAFQGV